MISSKIQRALVMSKQTSCAGETKFYLWHTDLPSMALHLENVVSTVVGFPVLDKVI